MSGPVRDGREEAKRTIYVEPSAIPLREVSHFIYRIEVPSIHLAGHSHEDGWRTVERLERGLHGSEVHTTHGIPRVALDARSPDPEE